MNPIQRNTAGQKIRVFAFNTTTGAPVTGDALNITAVITLDSGTEAASNDVNPTELNATTKPGKYEFDLTQAETNGTDYLDLDAVSATADVEVITEGGRRPLVPPGFFDDGFISTFDEAVDTVNLSTTTKQQIDNIQTELTIHLLAFAHFGAINDATPSTTEVTISGSQFVNADDYYNGMEFYVLSGAGSPRSTGIADQIALTLTLSPALEVTPENGAIIAIMKR